MCVCVCVCVKKRLFIVNKIRIPRERLINILLKYDGRKRVNYNKQKLFICRPRAGVSVEDNLLIVDKSSVSRRAR